MADVQFEEEQQYQPAYQQAEYKPLLIRLVLATGIVSTDKQAEYVLLGFALAVIILSFIILFLFGSSQVSVPQNVMDAAMRQR
ncbi:MAG: hypothetical protein HYT30_02195 [Parcubacteria group bacterium]|nr:hypothetical protein [Parcubacteria group bacterium]